MVPNAWCKDIRTKESGRCDGGGRLGPTIPANPDDWRSHRKKGRRDEIELPLTLHFNIMIDEECVTITVERRAH